MPSYLEEDFGNSSTYTAMRLKLIDSVRREPGIYAESRLKPKLLEKYFVRVARALGYRRERFYEVYMAWKSLKEQYKREARKVQRGEVAENAVKWPFYRHLKWLDDAPAQGPAAQQDEDDEEDDDAEEPEDEEPMVLDGSQNNGMELHDDQHDVHNGQHDIHDGQHDIHDNDGDNVNEGEGNAAYAQPPPPPNYNVVEEYVVENPVNFEKLPALIAGVEQQLEAASSWQVMQGQVLGQRLKELPVRLQRDALDELNAVMARYEEKALADVLPQQPPTFGSPPSESGDVDVINTSDDFTEKLLNIDEHTDA